MPISTEKESPTQTVTRWSRELEQLGLPKISEGLQELSGMKMDDMEKVSAERLRSNLEDMLSVIRSMERDLRDAMEMNVALRMEAKKKDQEIVALHKQNDELLQKIANLENETPLAAEAEKRFDLSVEKLDEMKQAYEKEVAQKQGLLQQVNDLQAAMKKTQTERDDAYREIVMLVNKLEAKSGGG